ncbi:DNA-binding GntR family transcriptional regulator [Amycolatopsis endophytica]|uniref:DNA-binding GntR family transcriptional regulator n=1 Tax=Amycolatopsis endophytica TaxID=860233 RepID=A0A853BC57_9PSEU|nr:GntR family transcriptional regulator [Amycolatopsis endophytica]NYI92365.1 DNA-binding GntR family transcriptional regulator [Amycolatopsis endophytica]
MHDRIRSDILRGRWAPGDRLQPAALTAEYGASTTVIREALTRLVGQKFVKLEPNRGFSVPRLREDELRDLTLVRCHMESLALGLALERGDVTWESELIAAHHRLARMPRRLPGAPAETSEEWSAAHRSFHYKLVEGCGVPTLLEMCADLSDATELYRRWSAPRVGPSSRDVESEHAALLEAALARDVDAATSRLRAHYEKTVEILLQGGFVQSEAAR